MVNFPPTLPVGSAARPVSKPATNRSVSQSGAAKKREVYVSDRRRSKDRRSRRGVKQIMDRRSGGDRRRSTIDLSV